MAADVVSHPGVLKIKDGGVVLLSRAFMWSGVVIASCAPLLPIVLPRHDTRTVMAIYPPWWSQERTFDAATAATKAGAVAPAAVSFAVLVLGSRDTVLDSLRHSGAVLILNAEVPLCNVKSN